MVIPSLAVGAQALLSSPNAGASLRRWGNRPRAGGDLPLALSRKQGRAKMKDAGTRSAPASSRPALLPLTPAGAASPTRGRPEMYLFPLPGPGDPGWREQRDPRFRLPDPGPAGFPGFARHGRDQLRPLGGDKAQLCRSRTEARAGVRGLRSGKDAKGPPECHSRCTGTSWGKLPPQPLGVSLPLPPQGDFTSSILRLQPAGPGGQGLGRQLGGLATSPTILRPALCPALCSGQVPFPWSRAHDAPQGPLPLPSIIGSGRWTPSEDWGT